MLALQIPLSGQVAQAAAPAPAAAPQPFPVLEFQIDGNTLLPTIEVERAVMSHLGESRTIQDIEAARAQLETVYHERGYKTVIVNIPEQRISDGIVRLHVTEAPVGTLHIAGSHYHSLEGIRGKLSQFDEGNVPNFTEVQKELGTVNRTPDLRVTPVLKASSEPGHVDVDLDVKDELPVHATLEANNRYSANTAKVRLQGEVSYDNLFQSGQSASIQYQVAPEHPSNAQVWSLSYVIPTDSNRVWALYAVHSDSNIAAVGDVNVIGKGNIVGARLILSLPTQDRFFYHSFTGGIDYKDLQQNILLQTTANTITSPAKYPAFSAQYSATWLSSTPPTQDLAAATNSGVSNTVLDAGISFIVRGLGTDREQFVNRRAGAGTSYFIFRPSIERQQVLWGQWSLVGKVDGQAASGPLLNSEEYSAGGADTVRGYTESERLADNGVRGSLELRTPQLFVHRWAHVERSYALLFAEGAHLRVIEPLPEQESKYTLASAGVGLRFKRSRVSVNLDGARILKDGSVTFAGRYRGLFQITYAY